MTFYFDTAKGNGRMIGLSYFPKWCFIGKEYPAEIRISLWCVAFGVILGKERVIK